jgi:thiosulfate dehydrogenase [quinone] large subunit
VATTAKEFEATLLPMPLVLAFCWTLPALEAATGLWLLSGLKARWSLLLGSLMMVALEFGTALRSDWMTLGAQMVYSLLYFVLLFTCSEGPREFEASRQTGP